MQESYSNKGPNYSKHEIFSNIQIPPARPFLTRLDGRRFNTISEDKGAEKTFDKRFSECLVKSKKAVTRRQIEENWEPRLFSSEKGQVLVQRILEWARPEKGR